MKRWWNFQKDILICLWVIVKLLKNCYWGCPLSVFFWHWGDKKIRWGDNLNNKFSVIWQLLKYKSRYLSEIFTICSSHDCANLMKKFLPLLNQPARNGPFLPKFWTALATVIVGIFFRKKFWWGLRPISVAYQKEFWISWKKWRFQIFQKPSSPGF